VIFEDVRVPVENRLGRDGEGFQSTMQVLDRVVAYLGGLYRRRRI